MLTLFDCPRHTLALSHAVLLSGLVLLALGILGGYVVDHRLGLAEQTLAHLLIITGPILLKVGYIIRINAGQRLHRPY